MARPRKSALLVDRTRTDAQPTRRLDVAFAFAARFIATLAALLAVATTGSIRFTSVAQPTGDYSVAVDAASGSAVLTNEPRVGGATAVRSTNPDRASSLRARGVAFVDFANRASTLPLALASFGPAAPVQPAGMRPASGRVASSPSAERAWLMVFLN